MHALPHPPTTPTKVSPMDWVSSKPLLALILCMIYFRACLKLWASAMPGSLTIWEVSIDRVPPGPLLPSLLTLTLFPSIIFLSSFLICPLMT